MSGAAKRITYIVGHLHKEASNINQIQQTHKKTKEHQRNDKNLDRGPTDLGTSCHEATTACQCSFVILAPLSELQIDLMTTTYGGGEAQRHATPGGFCRQKYCHRFTQRRADNIAAAVKVARLSAEQPLN